MQEKMGKWLSEVFALRVSVRPARVGGMGTDDRFDLWSVRGMVAPFVLVTPKPGVGNPSVGEIARLVADLSFKSFHPAAYGCGSLSAVERKRLLARQVPFVVAGRQAFLPFLGIALRADSAALTRKWLGSAAQEVLLARVRGWQEGVITDRTVEQLAGCSRASAFRALGELTAFGLIERVGYGYTFVSDVVQRLRLHMPRLRASPVRDALVDAALDGGGIVDRRKI